MAGAELDATISMLELCVDNELEVFAAIELVVISELNDSELRLAKLAMLVDDKLLDKELPTEETDEA
jgi:hypothetical protein